MTYLGLLGARVPARGGDDARRAAWFELGELPPLAFDHARIVADAVERAQATSR